MASAAALPGRPFAGAGNLKRRSRTREVAYGAIDGGTATRNVSCLQDAAVGAELDEIFAKIAGGQLKSEIISIEIVPPCLIAVVAFVAV